MTQQEVQILFEALTGSALAQAALADLAEECGAGIGGATDILRRKMPVKVEGGGHADWYVDGVEGREQCWRLDFLVQDSEFDGAFRAQVFARPVWDAEDMKAKQVEDSSSTSPTRYHSFRLDVEREVRDEEGRRIDYAFKVWMVSSQFGVTLLCHGEAEALDLLSPYVDEVLALPNEPDYCRGGKFG